MYINSSKCVTEFGNKELEAHIFVFLALREKIKLFIVHMLI